MVAEAPLYREVNAERSTGDIPVDIEVGYHDFGDGDWVKASELNVGENVSVVYDEDFKVFAKVSSLRKKGRAARQNNLYEIVLEVATYQRLFNDSRLLDRWFG